MNRLNILEALDAEITRLQQARTLLADAPDVLPEAEALRRGPGRPKSPARAAKETQAPIARKRTMSPEGKARIAAAQKSRWAKLHKAAKTSIPSKGPKKQATKAVKKTSGKAASKKKVATAPETGA